MRAALAIGLLLVARAAAAQDQFEIQVYDAETAGPGESGMETHLNFFALGTTGASAAGEAPNQHVTHVTFEPHVGLAWWCEAGAYFQTAFRADGTFDYAGVKLRYKARLKRRWHNRIGLALNLEFSSVPRRFEATGAAMELRPIIDFRFKRIYAAFNPILSVDFAGAAQGRPQLEPALALEVALVGPLSAGAEYYGAFGPLDHFGAEQSHRIFGVADLVFKRWALQVGAGYGLAGPERVIAKAIVSIDFTGR
ncbi:MAG TPA: hypothetical protein VFF06_05965 [Polyangia bacterium]|nr:hypothetical protein [Polyangia bacterium]